MLTIQFDDGGSQRSLELLADSFGEIRPVFAQYTKWMREEVQAVFDSQGEGRWPARSLDGAQRLGSQKAARIAKIQAAQYNSLRGALRSERRKAERRYRKSQGALRELVGAETQLTARRRKSLERYDAMQAELERFAAGGAKSEEKTFKKLNERIGRREQRAQKKIAAVEQGRLLGQIANSLAVRFDRSGWEMFSRIPWAGAHNEGATVGRGATLPARTFLEWTPQRLEKFVEMANEYVMSRAEKAKGKR